MSIPAPTYTYKGLSYEVEEDLYLGLKYNDLGAGTVQVKLGSASSVVFGFGGYGGYAQIGDQFGNAGYSYQVNDNAPVFVPRQPKIYGYYGTLYYDYGDARRGPTEMYVSVPADEIPDTGEVNIRFWASDADHKPTSRLTHIDLGGAALRTSTTEVKVPVTEDLILLHMGAAPSSVVELPDLRRARNLQFLRATRLSNTEYVFDGLTKLRKLLVQYAVGGTSVSCVDLDELLSLQISNNATIQSVDVSGCFNLTTFSISANTLLTSVRLIDFYNKAYYSPYPGYYSSVCFLTSNPALTGEALNQVYRDLADTSENRKHTVDTPSWIQSYPDQVNGMISVTNTLGATSDDPSIAIAKGWIITGT